MSDVVKLTKKDFASSQEVKWCPGCGDYAIINSVQKTLADLGRDPATSVFISGIGCSSRFPYYMNTYGFHTIHGRAPGIATGLKESRPDLDVWVITGDGDALAIGGNHFIHAIRRNVNLKILLFNNKIYGLTKGQYSPTSDPGAKSKSTPYGSLDRAFNPVQVALGAGGTFVARSTDVSGPDLANILKRAAEHRGTALVEILQNCVVFNDGAFDKITDKATKDQEQLRFEHGKPLLFAKGTKGVQLVDGEARIVDVGPGGVPESQVTVWNERSASAQAFALAALKSPTALGIFHAVEDTASLHELDQAQEQSIIASKGMGDLEELLNSGDTWTVG